MSPQTFLISRTDSIGDVILTLPVAGIIKERFPDSKIIFLAKTYTKDVVLSSEYINEFMDWSAIEKQDFNTQLIIFKKEKIDVFIHIFPNKQIARIASKANIPLRIGTSHRPYNLFYCNKLLNFSRKNSDLHEAVLNIKLLKPLGIEFTGNPQELSKYYGFTKIKTLDTKWADLLSIGSQNIILHPKSKGSAREWGLDNFNKLIQISIEKGARVFLTGTEEEGKLFRKKLLQKHSNLFDLSGKMSLDELISFINAADVIVAASTGPLHIAAASGTKAIGIFPPIHPMHPERWAPIGKNTKVFVLDKPNCNDCKDDNRCKCMLSISANEVANEIFHSRNN